MVVVVWREFSGEEVGGLGVVVVWSGRGGRLL